MPRSAPSKKIRLGQFYTSSAVARLMVGLADAPKNSAVCESGYGEGAFLAARGHFEVLVHFSEYKLFEDCAPNAIIFKYRKGKKPRQRYIKVAEFEGRRGQTPELIRQAKRGLASLRADRAQERRDGDWR